MIKGVSWRCSQDVARTWAGPSQRLCVVEVACREPGIDPIAYFRIQTDGCGRVCRPVAYGNGSV